jgi:hypothetical protein
LDATVDVTAPLPIVAPGPVAATTAAPTVVPPTQPATALLHVKLDWEIVVPVAVPAGMTNVSVPAKVPAGTAAALPLNMQPGLPANVATVPTVNEAEGAHVTDAPVTPAGARM